MIRTSFLTAALLSLLPNSAVQAYIPENWESEYEWYPEKSTSGPVLLVVDLDAQESFVYRNGVEIGKTPVSTGKAGHRTPTGIFQILNKDADHHSSTYNNASMPFSERLTWSGIALHAGALPGYPSSHGCIHLPYSFAKKLFEVTHKGTAVVITQKGHAPHKGDSPVAALLGLEEDAIKDGELDELDDSITWKPGSGSEGSVTIFFSGKHGKVEVFQGGSLIGKAPLKLSDPSVTLPTAAMVLLEDLAEQDESQTTSSPAPVLSTHWATISTSGESDAADLPALLASNVVLPAAFKQRLHQIVAPGTLVVTTAEEVSEETRSAEGFHLVNAGKPGAPAVE